MNQQGFSDGPVEIATSGAGLSPDLVWAPGGHLWWYVDLIDDRGNGLVVIWSFGLPFLPGYTDASRRGVPQCPRKRPSLNVATYRRARRDIYLLCEFEPDDVDWEPTPQGDRWRFGRSHIRSDVRGRRRRIDLDLHVEMPHHPQDLELRLHAAAPAIRRPGQSHDPSFRQSTPLPRHDWIPLAGRCDAEAVLRIGSQSRQLRGRLYHDRNGGRAWLDDLDIERWMWGRIPLPNHELIYYVVDGDDDTLQTLLWLVDEEGVLRQIDDARLDRRDRCENIAGLCWWSVMDIDRSDGHWLQIEHRDIVDNGPFYLRTLPVATDRRGRRHRGVAEVCEPARVDLPRFRPFVRMRVYRRGESNSLWLPLFSGPRRGRLRRLARSVASRLSWTPLTGENQ